MTAHPLSLRTNDLRTKLIDHNFFSDRTLYGLSRDEVATVVGQWWHPLSNFPRFLSQLIAVVPSFEVQTAVSRILFEELGEGDPQRAHPIIYIDSMTAAGFTKEEVIGAPRLPATAALIDGYETSTVEALSGLGYLYGTETADLAMVSGIGKAVYNVSQCDRLPWVDIHVQQEPGHVNAADEAIAPRFSQDEEAAITRAAEQMWSLWIDFFAQFDLAVSRSA
ncbi:Pyrroloquinoline quinone (Coenzyme PQQ) biosynthesis protein C [Mycobacterium basiliense]|uniref:Pyrroloquinoline quinone (Coenzyme PQQ) biosynthesis protein C n=1 Tax=Mycobacterium basiliense TaxID=2094119 RepID=A0A3S4BTV3_9MYCO|nr:iron-containing redox enzyme family protein [Mycobacterium basiliense]VDM87532.1 Pyrroloquinoline quinone (Coenzyme PQQ) biosynthesis protein C [Mycobacterium basiliense]